MASLIRMCQFINNGRACKCEATHRGFKVLDTPTGFQVGDWHNICAPHVAILHDGNSAFGNSWHVDELDD